MVFKPGQIESITAQWTALGDAHRACSNMWQESWEAPYSELDAAFTAAQKENTPQAWRYVCDKGRALRDLMRHANGEESQLYLKLVRLTDSVDLSLAEAASDPENLLARKEALEASEAIGEVRERISEERDKTPIWHRQKLRSLDESDKEFERGQRQINILTGNSFTINVNADGIGAAVKDIIDAVRKGVETLQDKDFTGAIKRAADRVWTVAKRFAQATKERFNALRLPWPHNGLAWQRVSNPEMVLIPAGKFLMGSVSGEAGRADNEGPQHEVKIPKAFAVGRFAVTRGEFAAFASDTGYKMDGGAYVWTGKEWKLDPKKSWCDPGFAQDDSHPVVCVNWNDAKAYIAWLNGVSGGYYRLLSEAEWEYACRAGSSTPFWWGTSITPEQANYNGDYTYNRGPKGAYRQKTVPVESFKRNPWGLFQMHGNVWEWCEDCWNDSYKDAASDGSARTTGDCDMHVLRGGSWYLYPQSLRSARRVGISRVNRFNYIGFRVARTLNL